MEDIDDVRDDKDKNDLPASGGEAKDKVDFATYKKLLDQRKTDQAKLKELQDKFAAIEADKKSAEEKENESKGNWKALIESRDNQIKELAEKLAEKDGKLSQFEEQITDAKKLSAFKAKIGGDLKKQEYYSFVDTDKIAIDPETGKVDPKSVELYANEFLKEHKDLIKFSTARLPDGAGAPGGKLSYDEWLKLPLSEQRARMKDVK